MFATLDWPTNAVRMAMPIKRPFITPTSHLATFGWGGYRRMRARRLIYGLRTNSTNLSWPRQPNFAIVDSLRI